MVNPILRRIVAAVAFGGVAYVGSLLLDLDQTAALTLLSGLFIGGAAVVVESLTEVRDELTRSVRAAQSDVGSAIGQAEADIVKSVGELEYRIEGLLPWSGALRDVEASALHPRHVLGLISSTGQVTPGTHDLLIKFATMEINRMEEFFRQLGNGWATHAGEDREWLLNLTRCARDFIWAISTPSVDGSGFWTSELGKQYLNDQMEATLRGVTVRRVFVRPSGTKAASQLLDTCALHVDSGVEVRVITQTNFARLLPRAIIDFIVFDGAVSYETSPGAGDPRKPEIESTNLRVDPSFVRDRVSLFARIWENSDKFDQNNTAGPPLARP